MIARASAELRGLTVRRLGLDAELPLILVYPTLDSLRKHSCTSKNAVAYYDGAIHLAAAPGASPYELIKSLKHEFAHHALVSNGVGAPLWLQEGLAMTLAGDHPHDYYSMWRKHPIDLRRMVDFMPHRPVRYILAAFRYTPTGFRFRYRILLSDSFIASTPPSRGRRCRRDRRP